MAVTQQESNPWNAVKEYTLNAERCLREAESLGYYGREQESLLVKAQVYATLALAWRPIS